jgi:hypothetical protein
MTFLILIIKEKTWGYDIAKALFCQEPCLIARDLEICIVTIG